MLYRFMADALFNMHMSTIPPQTVTCTTLREDEELRQFFETIVSNYLNSHSQYARIDILNCPGTCMYTIASTTLLYTCIYMCMSIVSAVIQG